MCQFNTLLRKLILVGVVAAAASLSAQAHAGGNISFGGSNGFHGNGNRFGGKGFGGSGNHMNTFNGENFSGNGFNNGFGNFPGNGFNNGFHFSSEFSGHKFGVPTFPTKGHFPGPVFVPHPNHFQF